MRKTFILITLFYCCFLPFSSQAQNQSSSSNKNSKFDFTLRGGVSKQNVGFDTPAAHSVLNWDADNIDVGADLRWNNFYDKASAIFEYSYGKVKGGKSSDDDVKNGFDTYSIHGTEGRSNNYKLTLDHKVFEENGFSLFPVAGAFYHQAKFTSTNGHGIGSGYSGFMSFEGEGAGQQTDSKFWGIIAGGKVEFKTKNTKNLLEIDALIPVDYKSYQVWYGRDPDLCWKLHSNKGGSGFRVKIEHGYKVSESFLKYLKLYAYYEKVKMNGLTETDEGEVLDSIIDGSAWYEVGGAGIALEF